MFAGKDAKFPELGDGYWGLSQGKEEERQWSEGWVTLASSYLSCPYIKALPELQTFECGWQE